MALNASTLDDFPYIKDVLNSPLSKFNTFSANYSLSLERSGMHTPVSLSLGTRTT